MTCRGPTFAWKSVTPSGGTEPISITQHGDLVYVLDGGSKVISGFRLTGGSGLSPLGGSTQPLGSSAAGAEQVQFSNNGQLLVVTEKTSNTIDTFEVGAAGLAGPVRTNGAPGGPFASTFDNRGDLLVAGVGAPVGARSYDVSRDGELSTISEVANFQAGACWIVLTNHGRFVYTSNAGSSTISGFAVRPDSTLRLLVPGGVSAGLGAGGHPLDLAAAEDGRYLYNLTDGFHEISELKINDDGSLTLVAAATGLPVGDAGLAAG